MEWAREVVAAEVPPETRPAVMEMVDTALRASLPGVLRGRASRAEMDEFYRNMLMWAALREVASFDGGRDRTLEGDPLPGAGRPQAGDVRRDLRGLPPASPKFALSKPATH
jgi:hypothetical protein